MPQGLKMARPVQVLGAHPGLNDSSTVPDRAFFVCTPLMSSLNEIELELAKAQEEVQLVGQQIAALAQAKVDVEQAATEVGVHGTGARVWTLTSTGEKKNNVRKKASRGGRETAQGGRGGEAACGQGGEGC